MTLGTETTASGSFAAEVVKGSGERPATCYQCGKCTAGCPVAFAMDIDPTRLMRLVQLGQREVVLNSRTIWVCASCETCTARCPQEVDLARVMDALRIMARRAGRTSAGREVAIFNRGFLSGVRARGRLHETALVIGQNLKTFHPFRDVAKAPFLMLKGKLSLVGHRAPNLVRIRRLFENLAKMEEGSE